MIYYQRLSDEAWIYTLLMVTSLRSHASCGHHQTRNIIDGYKYWENNKFLNTVNPIKKTLDVPKMEWRKFTNHWMNHKLFRRNTNMDANFSIPLCKWWGKITMGWHFTPGLGFSFVGSRWRGGGAWVVTRLTGARPRHTHWAHSESVSGVTSEAELLPELDLCDIMYCDGEVNPAYFRISSLLVDARESRDIHVLSRAELCISWSASTETQRGRCRGSS